MSAISHEKERLEATKDLATGTLKKPPVSSFDAYGEGRYGTTYRQRLAAAELNVVDNERCTCA